MRVGIARIVQMKKSAFIFSVVCLFASLELLSGGQAQIHLYSLSVRFQPAATKSFGFNYNLELTSDSPTTTDPNGELAPLPDGAPSTHGAFDRMTRHIFDEPVYGAFSLNVPAPEDSNTNGIPDFFEISQAVAATTTKGAFDDAVLSGKVTTTWSRSAGTNTGTCKLTMDSYGVTFIHTFQIQEYSGVLKYSTSATNVTGTVALTNVTAATRNLAGAVLFEKASPDQLKLGPGTWTSETKKAVAFQGAAQLDRNGSDYFGIFIFNDGDLSTSAEDYFIWLIKITDPNDANRNGIPDLSDEPVARRPSLTISRAGTNLLLSVSGEIGKAHQVEQTPALIPSNWTLATTLTPTNDPQVVRLTPPTNGVSFWRVKAP